MKKRVLAKHSENDFAIPALKALYGLGGRAMMSDIKDKIPEYIDLWEGDLEPFVSRKTRKESRYRQVVGNITSHHNDIFYRYAFRNNDNTLELTEEGKSYISSLLSTTEKPETDTVHEDPAGNEETAKETVSNEVATDIPNSEEADPDTSQVTILSDQTLTEKAEVNPTDGKYMQLTQEKGLTKRLTGDSNIRDAVFEISGYECQYAKYTGQKHSTFKKEDGKPYVEGHHLIPMAARRDFFPRNLDRPSNLVCLCPTCHGILHHGSREEKAKMLSVLYGKYIQTLNEEQIYITFEELMSYYGGGQ